MVKMEVMFKNGIAVRDLPELYSVLKKYGGEGVFVPLKSEEAQNTSDNTQSHAICPRCNGRGSVGDNLNCSIECSACFGTGKLTGV